MSDSQSNDYCEFSSKEVPDSFISAISHHICALLNIPLRYLFAECQFQDEKGRYATMIYQTSKGRLYEENIKNFFYYLRKYVKLSVSELICVDDLLCRLLFVDADNVRLGKQTIVCENNLGTLLVCSVILVMKMNRDTILNNSWWANKFKIPLNILNDSEILFFKKIDFRCVCPSKIYWEHFFSLLNISLPLNSQNNYDTSFE